MQIPIDITFHQVDSSDAVEAAIQRWVARLERVYDRLIKVEVNIDQPHKHHHKGREYRITVRLGIPGNDIIVADYLHEDIYVLIADAFRAARRQLLDHAEVARGFAKAGRIFERGTASAIVMSKL